MTAINLKDRGPRDGRGIAAAEQSSRMVRSQSNQSKILLSEAAEAEVGCCDTLGSRIPGAERLHIATRVRSCRPARKRLPVLSTMQERHLPSPPSLSLAKQQSAGARHPPWSRSTQPSRAGRQRAFLPRQPRHGPPHRPARSSGSGSSPSKHWISGGHRWISPGACRAGRARGFRSAGRFFLLRRATGTRRLRPAAPLRAGRLCIAHERSAQT